MPMPRLIFLTAPLIYLLLSHTNVPGYWAAILAYALPHLTLSNLTNSRIQGEHRHSFWNEIYETVLSPYILLPTMMALINPKLGKFNVTAKGGVVKRSFFDVKIAQPFLVLLFFNFLGLLIAIPRFFIWDRDRPGTVIMNVLWCFLNIIVLGVCSAVSREMRQLRGHVRIRLVTPVTIRFGDGRSVAGETIDLSSGGTAIRLAEPFEVTSGEQARLAFVGSAIEGDLPSTIVSGESLTLRIKFNELTIPEQELLTTVLYSRADTWLGWGESREVDQPMKSLARIFAISFAGLRMTFMSLFFKERSEKPKGQRKSKGKPNVAAARAAHLLILMLLPLGLLLSSSIVTGAQGSAGFQTRQAIAKGPPPAPGQFRDVFSLADTGSGTIEMHGIDSQRSIYFTLQQTHVVKAAKIHIYYSFSPSLLPQLSHMQLMLNGTLFATLPIPPGESPAHGQQGSGGGAFHSSGTAGAQERADAGVYRALRDGLRRSRQYHSVGPRRTATYMDYSGDVLPLADDLKRCHCRFLTPKRSHSPKTAIVFSSAPSTRDMQAAGVVSQYFGMHSENRAVRFPT